MINDDKQNQSEVPSTEEIEARLHRDLVDTYEEELELEVDDFIGSPPSESNRHDRH